MAALVPIPWQPHLYLTPDTLALLVAASARRGTQLRVVGQDGAWRSYVLQKYYYDGYKAGKPGFNVASNPDIGQRSHMRGAAFDLVQTDAATQSACRAVGLVRDPQETWHWNNPRWASMPIIKTNTGPAGNGGTPITGAEDLDANQNNVLLWANENADKARLAATDANINADKARQHSERGAALAERALETAGWANTNADLARQAAQAALAKLDKLLTGSTGGTVAINYAALAKAVNDDAAKRLAN